VDGLALPTAEAEWHTACARAVAILKQDTNTKFDDKVSQAAPERKEGVRQVRARRLQLLDQSLATCVDRLGNLSQSGADKAAVCLHDASTVKELKACDPLTRPGARTKVKEPAPVPEKK